KIVQPGAESRSMRGSWRVADRKVAVLVLEHAVEHEKLSAATMRVGREAGLRSVAHDRGRPRHLLADAVEHAALDPADLHQVSNHAGRIFIPCRSANLPTAWNSGQFRVPWF